MDQYVARANIDHYLSLLNGAYLSSQNSGTITRLLLAEEDKLGHDLEQLEFAEARAAKSRESVNHFRNLRDAFAEGSADRANADKMLAKFEAIHELLEQFCRHMRCRANSRRL
jgi:hypothetical protein